ncbi:MAG: sugar phosphate isomerase/epimerase [Clostridia bacterium]|nr:sugar phosphate isomerase/epimerase [Clostridia bacterium]
MNKLGVKVRIYQDTDILAKLKEVKEYGFACCQTDIWDTALYTDEKAKEINDAVAETGVEISSLWAGWSGPCQWNFTAGPMTAGLIPPAYRMKRMEELLMAGDFAVKIGVSRVATHVGFLPENMNDPEYLGVVATIHHIAYRYKKKGLNFLFETGQETPIALLRIIEEVGTGNLGINMDTANLILYGKGNSADAITVFGKYVMDTHIKDGLYPTDGKNLGQQVKVGEGMANIPEVIKRLKAVGYTGNLIIEREVSGEQQIKDILDAKKYLEEILATLEQ